jgi:N-acetylmuramoyl-L-alanine amidase
VEIRDRPSPNFGPRRDALRPELVVLHYTAMASAEAALARLCDPGCEVSAHYLIAEDGRIFRLVDEAERAWHAGAGRWRGRDDINSRSIGIELDNDGASPFPEAQMAALEALLPGILDRWAVPPAGVIAHSDMAPGRKSDPGARFDWRRLARRGLALAPRAPGDDTPEAPFDEMLARIGYDTALPPDTLRDAFRLRHRPWGHGPVCDADRRLARAVLAAGAHFD